MRCGHCILCLTCSQFAVLVSEEPQTAIRHRAHSPAPDGHKFRGLGRNEFPPLAYQPWFAPIPAAECSQWVLRPLRRGAVQFRRVECTPKPFSSWFQVFSSDSTLRIPFSWLRLSPSFVALRRRPDPSCGNSPRCVEGSGSGVKFLELNRGLD